MPFPYSPPNVESNTGTPSHYPVLFCRGVAGFFFCCYAATQLALQLHQEGWFLFCCCCFVTTQLVRQIHQERTVRFSLIYYIVQFNLIFTRDIFLVLNPHS